MRNLRNIHRSVIQHPSNLKISASAWDVATDSAICAFGPSPQDPLVELKRWKKNAKVYEAVAAWEAVAPAPDLQHGQCDRILDLHYFTDSSTICLVFAGGDLVVVREDPQYGEDKIEIVGSVDAGISAASWSPDEELLAITTEGSTLLYMTRDFENVVDCTLSLEDLKVSQHVSVGWGKKETQFKGKKARALRDPTVPETVDEGSLSGLDDQSTTISWRGDGAFLAVNSIVQVEPSSRRVIRVYSREGSLDSVSEPVNGLEQALSWRPAGNLLAGIQRHHEAIRVVFFERNGLRHGQFDLRLEPEQASTWSKRINLRWNVDSSVLAVSFEDRVQLWTMSNYHYYLKQEVLTSPGGLEADYLVVNWHPEKPLHLFMHNHENLQRLAYASVISQHTTSPPYDFGMVAVIDGRNIMLTPLRIANVPPPMAFYVLEIAANAIDVATISVNGPKPFVRLGVLHHDGISIYDWPLIGLQKTSPRFLQHVDTSLIGQSFMYPLRVQISFESGYNVVVLVRGLDESIVQVVELKGDSDQQKATKYDDTIHGLIHNGPNVSGKGTIMCNEDTETLSTGAAVKKADEDLTVLDTAATTFPTSTLRTEAISYGYKTQPATERTWRHGKPSTPADVVFSLSENGSLFANNSCLTRNCTSFSVTSAHLIYTTAQHLLKIVHLLKDNKDFDIPPDTPEADEMCRSIERGAKIVSVIPSIFAIVLQMPRGNLETIYPRALVLAGIRKDIDKKRYKNAFLACRSQRVDMNILYDYAPQQFLSNVEIFVDQVEKIEYIDLFLSQLREEDVTETMYRETLDTDKEKMDGSQINGIQTAHRTAEKSKINQICNAFIDALKGRHGYTQNLISAYVCQNPPNLDDGLIQIAEMRAKESNQVDLAIEHVCFLADSNRLYDNALGLYDLELTLLIAQQSQKDPREYLPFLQNLQGMPEIRRKFSIDDYLGRHQKALDSLFHLNSFEEFKSYMVKHKLFNFGLEHYRYEEQRLADVMRLYAEDLATRMKFAEAAAAYEFLNDYETACDLYKRANLWKESLACAKLIPLSPPYLETLAQDLIASLIESKDFFAAAVISLDYLVDIAPPASLFCKGYHFADAIRIVTLHRRPDLLETVIDPGLVEGMASMTELIADCKAQLNAQLPRIQELRKKKDEDPLAFYDADGGAEDVDAPDNVSIAPTDASTTGGSLFTRYTNRSSGTLATNATRRTSRNRRREERKRARGKKGSVYEEEYLVNSVRRLIERINSINSDVERLVTGLMRRRMRERARAVEMAMTEIVRLCNDCIREVFGTSSETASLQNGDGPLNPGNHAPVGQNSRSGEIPMVQDFQKLSLLS